MSDFIDIRADLRSAQRIVRQMEKVGPKAASSALNRSAASARTAGARKVRERYTIKAKDVNAVFKIIAKPSASSLEAVLRSRTGSLPLINFQTKPNAPPGRQPRGGVKVGVIKGQRKALKHAFVAKVGSGGHIGVFERSTRRRLPIKELFGPPIPEMLNAEDVRQEIEHAFSETFERRLTHEMDRHLARLMR
ncbi:Prophage minor tail protein Z (GPZ) [compost metagenome]